MNKIAWHNLPIKEIFNLLKTSIKGLKKPEIEDRIKKYGLNKLPEEKRLSWVFVLLNQFKSPLIYILLVAALISFILHEYADTIVILAAVFINTIVGFIQENKAEKTLEQLKKIISFRSTVIRNGDKISIDSINLVVGDILVLQAGDRVPADGRIIECNDFQVNEASLTGESMPIDKKIDVLDKGMNLADRTNMVFMGTVITRGKANVVITSTGVKTHLGEIAKMVKEAEKEETPLQVKLAKFSRKLGLLVLAASVFVFTFGVLIGEDIFDMFETSVAVAVAAIPEGLIVAVTIILTVGMQRILKKKALVKKLVAAETLGSTSIICTDKTGTLTEGNMRVASLLTGLCDGENDLVAIDKKKIKDNIPDHYWLLKIAALCNDTIISKRKGEYKEEFIGDPTETALLKATITSGLDYEKIRQENKRIAEIPFSTEIKYMATLNQDKDNKQTAYIKGAPEKILSFADKILINGEEKKITPDIRKKVLHNFDQLTSQGLRVLAAAYKQSDDNNETIKEGDIKGFTFLGVLALKDPLRKEAKSTIDLCKTAGLHPVIITGDHKLTVKAIAQEVGIEAKDENILEGNDLDKLSDEELVKKVKNITVYARVSPKHKLRIVDAWQTHGEVVAMLGDGVNDAPALKKADIGVALGSGTDVAKETAEIVLLDDNFKTIVDAIRQGRIIFDNIRKVITYLLADSFTELILIIGALIARLPLPVTALQILYINIVDDGFPNVALTFEPGEKDVMKQKPLKKDTPILNKEMKFLIFAIGIVTDVVLFVVFLYLLNADYAIDHIRTIIFTALALDSLLYVFSCKSLRKNIWHTNIFDNKYLLLAVGFGLALQLFALYTPFMREMLELTILTSTEWVIIILLALVKISAIETSKWFFIRKNKFD
ncbi:cation-translocating P-type ATPase [Patescibacteria group bacterium]